MRDQIGAIEFEQPVTDGITQVTTFVPKLIGFLVILLIGYVVAKVVAKVLDKVLERAGFDEAVEKGPVKQALSRSELDASDIVSRLVFYVIFIPFLSAGVGVLGIAALEQPLADFIALLPKIVVAVLLVVIGGVVAGAVRKLVESSLGGLSYGEALANGLGVLVMLGFLKAALDEVGIATDVTGPILYALLATVAGILIVGVGGGLIQPVQARAEEYLNRASDEVDRIKDEAQPPTRKAPAKQAPAKPTAARTTRNRTTR